MKEARLTLVQRPDTTPTPQELYQKLMNREGWKYKSHNGAMLQQRDRALVSILYVAELRVSEAIRLTKDQFKEDHKKHYVHVSNILLAKRKKGKAAEREARLPLKGERACFTKLIMDYLATLKGEHERLFPWSLTERVYLTKDTYTTKAGETKPIKSFQVMGTKRAWQITKAFFPEYTEHFLRAFGDDYLYDHRGHDLLAVASEVKVDVRTLLKYLSKKQYLKYKPI